MTTPDYRPIDWKGDRIDRPLIDDLADVLTKTVTGWESVLGVDLAQAPEVQRVMARYLQVKDGNDLMNRNTDTDNA